MAGRAVLGEDPGSGDRGIRIGCERVGPIAILLWDFLHPRAIPGCGEGDTGEK
jgi:hypothetical protein